MNRLKTCRMRFVEQQLHQQRQLLKWLQGSAGGDWLIGWHVAIRQKLWFEHLTATQKKFNKTKKRQWTKEGGEGDANELIKLPFRQPINFNNNSIIPFDTWYVLWKVRKKWLLLLQQMPFFSFTRDRIDRTPKLTRKMFESQNDWYLNKQAYT